MAWNKPEINRITTDIADLTIFLRTTKKWGKSTLFRNLILQKYGDPSYGLSVSCGKEHGEKLLDNLNVTRVESYKDLLELKDWLINHKDEHNIKIISFDVVDELVPLFEERAIQVSNLENPTKKAKTINAAFGGFHNGQLYAARLIEDYMDELHIKGGFGIFGISHTKFKTIKEKGGLEEDGYMQLTSNLSSEYEAAFGNVFDVTLTGVIDRDVEEKKVEVAGKEKIKRYATSDMRKLYFRGTPMIDAGGRFADGAVPEYMVFDKPAMEMAKEFIDVVEEGMEKSKLDLDEFHKNKAVKKSAPTGTPAPAPQPEPEPEVEEPVEEVTEEPTETSDAPQLVEEARAKFKTADMSVKKEVKKLLNGGKLSEDMDYDLLVQIHDLLTKEAQDESI